MAERIQKSKRIETELSVGLTKAQADALAVATEFQGLKPSVYCRGAILSRLVAEGWLKHPGFVKYPELEKTQSRLNNQGIFPMRTKSAYKTPAPSVQIDDEPIQPSATTRIEFIDKTDPDRGTIASIDTAIPEPDEATLTLQKQIADLKKSEEMQREFARHVAVQRAAQTETPTLPADPEARIALWRTQGLSDHDADFISEHLELAVEPHLTRIASDEAAQHHERDTDAHRAATLEAFHRLQGQRAQPAVADPAGFFQPPEEPTRSPAATSPESIYSAPVSRSASPRGYREPSPRSVRLSPIEQEIARNLGLSDTAYAAGKIRLQKAKANGELQ